jgi:hypothetical protein
MSALMVQLRRILLYGLASVIVLIALVYAGDYVSIRYRIPHNRTQFGTVTVSKLYMIHEKNNKTEYQLAAPEDRTCVHSLFPQMGYTPCWYLSRHTEEHVEI